MDRYGLHSWYDYVTLGLLISFVVALPIYPLFGHWAWGGAFGGDPGWLANIGFVDFAGGTVVHSVAGWVG